MRNPSPFALLTLTAIASACGTDGTQPTGTADGGAPDLALVVYHRAPPRDEPAFGWDATSNKVVLFGGDDGMIAATTLVPSYHDDTWLYDVAGNAWSESAAKGPSARGRPAFAVDTKARRLLMTQGRYRVKSAGTGPTPYTLRDDTWAYDFAGDAWSQLATSGDPPPRAGASAVYDATNDRLVMFGGNTGTSFDVFGSMPNNETWQLAGGKTWSKVTTKGTPPSKRYLAGAALDSKRNRMIVVGGCCDNMGGFFSDTWALDLGTDTWTRLADSNAGPTNRFGHGAAYDAANDRVVVFGGHDDTSLGNTNEVWAVDADGNWDNLNAGDALDNTTLGCVGATEQPYDFVLPLPDSPERRERQVFLSIGDRILVAGGIGDCSQLDDTWTLQKGMFSKLIPPIHGESCLRRGDQCACLCQ